MAKLFGMETEIRCKVLLFFGNDDKGSKQVSQCEFDTSPQTYAPSKTRMYLHSACYDCFVNGMKELCCCHQGFNTSSDRLTPIPGV